MTLAISDKDPTTLVEIRVLVDRLVKVCYNWGLVRREYKMDVKQDILKRLAEVYCLVTEGMSDGKPVVDLDCFSDLENAMNTLAQHVEYYLD